MLQNSSKLYTHCILLCCANTCDIKIEVRHLKLKIPRVNVQCTLRKNKYKNRSLEKIRLQCTLIKILKASIKNEIFIIFANSNYISILECIYGYYGKKCKKRCSENCYVTRQCNGVTGQCNRGCKPGWTTTTCKQSRYFGKLLVVSIRVLRNRPIPLIYLLIKICIHIFLYLSNMS